MTTEKRKEYNKRYRETHREELLEKRREYKKKHREELNAYARQYRQDNLEKIRKQENDAYHRRRNEDPEKIREQRRQSALREDERNPGVKKERQSRFYENHPERKKGYSDKYCKTKKGRANQLKNSYIGKDADKGFSTDQNIDEKWILENLFNSSCIYCSDSNWEHLGADRVDNSKPHTPDNCVCSCGLCNMERSNKYSVEEFKEYRKTHPRQLGGSIEKSWEIVEQNGVQVIKKKN